MSIKKLLISVLPWLITILAIVYVCQGLDWQAFFKHARTGDLRWLFFAMCITGLSYLLRSYRWLLFFPGKTLLSYVNAVRVLILGFFMNNILPARTGELVRAHMGARVSGEKRTLVLATVASERLIDGLTLSLLFLMFSPGLNNTKIASNLFIVACLFAAITVGVFITIFLRTHIFKFVDLLARKINHRYTDYAFSRMQLFINGLTPLANPAKLPAIVILSIVTWGMELLVYFSVSEAFAVNLPLPALVLFMVTVNFSSLIPAAPGAIGVIEAVTTTVLVSIGIEKELALSMVLSQHIIQYLVVGIPGLIVLSTWKKQVQSIEQEIAA